MTRGATGEAGFSLVEVVVAAGLLATALVWLAGLFGLAIRSTLESRHATYATALAQAKVEELRAAARLSPSPAAALAADTPGFVDYVDQFGRLAGGAGASTPAVYTRRWAIRPLPDVPDTVVLQVLVRRRSAEPAAGTPPGRRLAGDVRLLTARVMSGN